MSVLDILSRLEELLPILGGLVGHQEVAILGQRLITLAEEEIARRKASSGQSRAEILMDAQTTYQQARQANMDLKTLGHELE